MRSRQVRLNYFAHVENCPGSEALESLHGIAPYRDEKKKQRYFLCPSFYHDLSVFAQNTEKYYIFQMACH